MRCRGRKCILGLISGCILALQRYALISKYRLSRLDSVRVRVGDTAAQWVLGKIGGDHYSESKKAVSQFGDRIYINIVGMFTLLIMLWLLAELQPDYPTPSSDIAKTIVSLYDYFLPLDYSNLAIILGSLLLASVRFRKILPNDHHFPHSNFPPVSEYQEKYTMSNRLERSEGWLTKQMNKRADLMAGILLIVFGATLGITASVFEGFRIWVGLSRLGIVTLIFLFYILFVGKISDILYGLVYGLSFLFCILIAAIIGVTSEIESEIIMLLISSFLFLILYFSGRSVAACIREKKTSLVNWATEYNQMKEWPR